MTNQRAIILLSQMYLPNFDDEEKDALTKAIEALTEQEPRVLTLDEVLSSPDTMIWVDEIWNDENTAEQYALIENFTYENCYVILRFFDGSSSEESTHYYNEKWRCWSARPTDEQREAVPWES